MAHSKSIKLDNRVAQATVYEVPTENSKGAVLLITAALPDKTPDYIAETVASLADRGYTTVTLDEHKQFSVSEIDDLVTWMKGDAKGGHVGVVAFGAAQLNAWDLLSEGGGEFAWGFLVSCPLPDPPPNFSALRETGIRGIYIEDGSAYKSSYLTAHHAMAAVPTPHNFMIYSGNISDNFYDDGSPDFNPATWKATQDALDRWVDLYSG